MSSITENEEWVEFRCRQMTGVGQALAYSTQTINFCERWVELMEAHMEKGESLETIATATSFVADDEVTQGMTFLMYQYALFAVIHYWKHGEELRLWHNRRFNEKEANHEGVIRCDSFEFFGLKGVILASYGDLRDGGIEVWRQAREAGVVMMLLNAVKKEYVAMGLNI